MIREGQAQQRVQTRRRSSAIPVSVVIMTKNEERALQHTLASVSAFDEVFVVDSHSTDRTQQVAEEAGAHVVQFSWNGGYPKKKEWSLLALPLANEWVLYLDADEVVTATLARELQELLGAERDDVDDAGKRTPHSGFDVELDCYFLGQLLRHGHKETKRILVRLDRTTWPHLDDLAVTNTWEIEGHYRPVIEGTVGRLRGRLEHRDRDPLYDYFARHNRYSDWEAHLRRDERLDDQVHAARSARARRYAGLPWRPAAFFLYSYLLRRGFLDGRAGFHYALARAFFFWQVRVKEIELTAMSDAAGARPS
jgi:glycosyltransferase involved in cell wall biosynthesis